MNLLLLANDQMKDGNRGLLSPRQKLHVTSVLKLKSGDSLRVGLVNGPLGDARLLNDPAEEVCAIEIQWNNFPPPTPVDLTVCIALPRPKAFRRLLFSLTVQGVKHFHFFHAYRVEKSY
jgi:16S rRNA (uracil1498-N3)-methyltransferase